MRKKTVKTMCTGLGCTCHNGGPCKSKKKVDKYFVQSFDDVVEELIKKGKDRGWEAETILEQINAASTIWKLLRKTKK